MCFIVSLCILKEKWICGGNKIHKIRTILPFNCKFQFCFRKRSCVHEDNKKYDSIRDGTNMFIITPSDMQRERGGWFGGPWNPF